MFRPARVRQPVRALRAPREAPREAPGMGADQSTPEAVSALETHLASGIFSEQEEALVAQLRAEGQDALFAGWNPELEADLDEKRAMMAQLLHLDATCPGGGIAAYLQRARELLAASAAGANPLEGWAPAVPTGRALDPEAPNGVSEICELEALGLPEVGRCCFVLVAGGLGERLGYSGIKIGLPVETATNTCYLEFYVRTILALQARHGAPCGPLPLAIMVSDDTAAPTRALLERHNFFGAADGQITLLKQEKVPALADSAARIAMKGPYAVDAKPHGHGDVHSLLHGSGLAARWSDEGRRWVVFFQDTNALAFFSLAAALGVSLQEQLAVNSITVPRKAKQAVGAIARLKHEDGREMTCNVEYNQLDPLLRATSSPEGDVDDAATGLSPFPGNINQLVVRLDTYAAVLRANGGLMPEFVNPKYKDEQRRDFKKPTRLETMMQDLPKCLPGAGLPAAKVGFTQAPAWYCFTPCKNSIDGARAAAAKGSPPACAAQAEADFYACNRRILRAVGADIQLAPPVEHSEGLPVSLAPAVVVAPEVAVFMTDFVKLSAAAAATTVPQDGCLVLDAAGVGEGELRSSAASVVFESVAEGRSVPEETAIRGYTTAVRRAVLL